MTEKRAHTGLFWGLAVLAAIAAGGYFLYVKAEAASPAPAVAAPLPADGIGALGQIEPRSRVIRVSHDAGPEGARIEILHVAEGASVKAGDVIATFSNYDLKEAQLAAAQARIPVLTAQLKEQEARLQFDKGERSRAEPLVQSKALSRMRGQELERNYRQSQASVESLRAEIDAAQTDIRIAERELERSRIVAPIDGTVIKILARPGERVADQGVIEMADLTAMDVVAQIYERDMPRIAIGQAAEIRVPGFDATINGEVRELGYQVRKNDLNDTDPLADRDNRVVEVRITLPDEAAAQVQNLIYMQVDVRIK